MTGRPPAVDLSVPALRGRITAVLGRGRRALAPSDRVPAAVLVLFVYRAGAPALVFGKKTEDVPHHKGQFSFPGGVVRRSDASVVEAALREAREEIGVEAAEVEVLGVLDDVPTTVTNFVISPVLALARGRMHVSRQDVIDLARPVLAHRVLMDARAQAEGCHFAELLDDLLARARERTLPDVSRWTREVLKR